MTWTVKDYDNDNEVQVDSRSEAEERAETAREFGSGNVEIVEEDDEPETDGGEVVETAQPVEIDPDTQTNGTDLTAVDPQSILLDRDWMLDTITHPNGSTSEDLNKRGCQVIAELLGAYPDGELIEYEPTAETPYAVAKATITNPETGETYTAHGEAWADERNVEKQGLVRQAETRAKKRAIKWVSASGAKVLVNGEGQGDADA